MSNNSFRYGVVGSGAVGLYYGGLLARSGREVHFLMRSDAAHVRSHGIHVTSVDGDYQLKDVLVCDDAAQMPPCDVTIVSLKTTANHHLQRLLPSPTSHGGLVLVAQNGLEPEADAAAVVGAERIFGGCCFLCSNKVGPGQIHHLDYGTITIGRYRRDAEADSDPMLQRLEADLVDAGIQAQAIADLPAARWKKLVWNIPFNGLSVVLNAATDRLLADCEPLVRQLMTETVAAAKACGSDLDPKAVDLMLEHTRKMVPYDSSMRLDWKAGREMEVESIFGAPVRAARAAGADVPKMEMLYEQLRFLNEQIKRRVERGS